MLRSRVVKAPLGAAFGVTAVPGRGVDGEDERPRRRAVSHEKLSKAILIDPTTVQGLIEAAVRAAELRLEAECGH